ncbi:MULTISPECIES: cupin domain-containing protein [unclassified Thioalkalivibrio]|uniref:cupin domain-containing protein n=1 Tax=unclassified Thioalkalivibrio TaxID=2621013 RepID=UPI00037418AE
MFTHCLSRSRIRHAIISLGAFASALALGAGAAAEPAPITAEPLTERHTFSGEVSVQLTQTLPGLARHTVEIDDASSLVVMEFTIQPGAIFPWHTHPGTVLVSIAEGELEFIFAEDCDARRLSPGTAVVDPGNEVHTARNPGEVPAIVIATLLGVPAEGGLTLPVGPDEALVLDERCGIETPGEHASRDGN